MPVHRALPAADAAFATVLAQSPRGPDRDGVFALWLVVRVALGAAAPGAPPARHAERLRALQHRLRSLTLAAPLKRALAAALADLAPARTVAPAIVLGHLVAPAAETVGRPVADAVAAAARAVRGPAPRAA